MSAPDPFFLWPAPAAAFAFAWLLCACSGPGDPAAAASRGAGGADPNGDTGGGPPTSHPGGGAAPTRPGGTEAAGASGGASSDGGAGGAGRARRGLAFSTTKGQCVDLDALGVSWFYNWRTQNPCSDRQVEFVPQVWGSWEKLDWVPEPGTVAAEGYPIVLGFNEPDRPDQANLTVDEALALWPAFELDGVRVGSPATVERTWLEEFMAGVDARGLRVDFITLHWYGWEAGHCDDVTRLESRIVWAEQWGLPIWITEWSCREHPPDVVERFFHQAVALFERHPLVERHAWFLSRSDGGFENARLVDSDGALTDLGQAHAALPAR